MNPEDSLLPRVPLGTWVDDSFDWLKENVSWLFDAFSAIMNFLVGNLTDLLMMIPALALIPILALIALTLRSRSEERGEGKDGRYNARSQLTLRQTEHTG